MFTTYGLYHPLHSLIYMQCRRFSAGETWPLHIVWRRLCFFQTHGARTNVEWTFFWEVTNIHAAETSRMDSPLAAILWKLPPSHGASPVARTSSWSVGPLSPLCMGPLHEPLSPTGVIYRVDWRTAAALLLLFFFLRSDSSQCDGAILAHEISVFPFCCHADEFLRDGRMAARPPTTLSKTPHVDTQEHKRRATLPSVEADDGTRPECRWQFFSQANTRDVMEGCGNRRNG